MNDRWRRADEIFVRALDVERDKRDIFVDEACAGDGELGALVRRLLETDEQGETTVLGIDSSAQLALRLKLDDELAESSPDAGAIIDRYRVIGEIGRGGMAVVYLAERADDQFEHRVALKLIKRGIDTDEVLRRFAQERQIMALSRHPDIARLLDGGTTPDGRPYFVMEYVEGRPIDSYCDEQRLPVAQRLALFLRVAGAVADAHRNLVVHRDIKPSNILVSDAGDVKLLDFGIAAYLDADGGSQRTKTGARFMTPAFASPEQISGGVVTTASDVYQLGLLLYVLLTGRSPYRTEGSDADSLRRAICHEPPARPRALLHRTQGESPGEEVAAADRISRQRSTTPGTLRRELSGDLENILLMALRKEPERRYPSVAQLIDDVDRYIAGRPVSARPDTLTYRASKFVRRHRVAAAFAGAALLSLIAFAATMTWQAARIADERDRANREASAKSQVSDFLKSLFTVSDPDQAQGDTVTARELLDQGAARIDETLQQQPDVQAELMDTMGEVYANLGLYDAAEPLLTRALDQRRELFGDDAPETLTSARHLADLYWSQSRLADAEPLYLDVLERRRRRLGPQHADTIGSMVGLANLYLRQNRFEEAEPLYRAALDARLATLGPNHEYTLAVKNNLAVVAVSAGRYDDAERLYEEVVAAHREALGDRHPDTLSSRANLASHYRRLGRYQDSRVLNEEVLELRRLVLGDDHPDTLASIAALAVLHESLGDPARGLALLGEVLRRQRETLGDDNVDTMSTAGLLANSLRRAKRYDEAEPLMTDGLERRTRVLGEEHALTLDSRNDLANLYLMTKRYDEAEPLYREVLEVRSRRFGDDHPDTIGSMNNLAALYWRTERYDEAEPLYLRSLDGRRRALGEDHPKTFQSMRSLGMLYAAVGRHDEAEKLYEQVVDGFSRVLGEEHPRTRGILSRLTKLYAQRGKADEAQASGRRLLDGFRGSAEADGAGPEEQDEYLRAWVSIELDELFDAEAALQAAVVLNESSSFRDPRHLETLALIYHRGGDHAKALETQRRAVELSLDDQARARATEILSKLEAGDDNE